MYNKTTMDTKSISLSLPDAKKLYFSGDDNFKLIALSAYSKEELEERNLPTSWIDLNKIDGYFINGCSDIYHVRDKETKYINKNIFATEEQAISTVAYAQLTQLVKEYNDGWEPDWNKDEPKYSIRRYKDKLYKNSNREFCHPITFKSAELRDKFFDNFQDLLKQYFMIK